MHTAKAVGSPTPPACDSLALPTHWPATSITLCHSTCLVRLLHLDVRAPVGHYNRIHPSTLIVPLGELVPSLYHVQAGLTSTLRMLLAVATP